MAHGSLEVAHTGMGGLGALEDSEGTMEGPAGSEGLVARMEEDLEGQVGQAGRGITAAAVLGEGHWGQRGKNRRMEHLA